MRNLLISSHEHMEFKVAMPRRWKILYRNSEGYADPTEGCALEHMAYEERKQRRLTA